MVLFLSCLAVLWVLANGCSSSTCRDRFLWPFSSDSVWNMPIGSEAQFVPGGIYLPPHKLPQSFHNDQDFFVLTTKEDPITPWINQGNWDTATNHCAITGKQADSIPVPYNFTVGCVMNNNAAGFLMPDNRTLVQMQPLYRISPGAPILALYHQGGPDPFLWTVDILGGGALGAHGGSGLSSVGGTIRLGELLPEAPPITHALKLELYAHEYYHYGTASTCFTWPATGCDGYAATVYNGTNQYIKPGALLAVPTSISSNVTVATIPGKKILQALTTYGGYIVDDTATPDGAICMEAAVTEEILQAYGYSVDITNPITPSQGGSFYDDLVAIFQALHVVINNSNSTVGGGGKPLAPLAPPICDD